MPNKPSIDTSKLRKSLKQTKQIKKERVQTGIPGLDEVMSGGFVKNSVNIVIGGAGCGKSIFGMEYLVNGVDKYDENGIFISFEEDVDKILRDLEAFGWDLKEKIDKRKLIILSYKPEQVQKVIEQGAGTIVDHIKEIKAKRIVIDSVTAFTLMHQTEFSKQKAALTLFNTLADWECTALLTAEQEVNPNSENTSMLVFEADGVIALYNLRKDDIRVRGLEIIKMRGTKHSSKIFPIKIKEKGIVLYSKERIF